jgi:hypothetical protein
MMCLFQNFPSLSPKAKRKKENLKVYCSVLLLKPLNAELNPICHLLALAGVHHFVDVSRINNSRFIGDMGINVIQYSVTQKEHRPYCEKRASKLFLNSKRFLEFRALSERREKAHLHQPKRAFSALGTL